MSHPQTRIGSCHNISGWGQDYLACCNCLRVILERPPELSNPECAGPSSQYQDESDGCYAIIFAGITPRYKYIYGADDS